MHKGTASRAAISVAAVIACLVVAGAAGAGLFFALSSPNAFTTINQSSSSSQSVALSSSESGSSTSAVTGTNSTTSLVTYGQTQIVFGYMADAGQSPTQVFPNDTMIWTNYVLPISTYIQGVSTSVITTLSTPPSTVIMAVYINGNLIGQDRYNIGPPTSPASQPNYTLPAGFTSYVGITVTVQSAVQAGATVSVAIWCSSSPTMDLDNNDQVAHGTFEYALPTSTVSLPQSLPSTSQSVSSGPDFLAFNQGE